jgi:hypothetical protein
MSDAHGLLPLRLADGEQRLPAGVVEPEGRDIDLVGLLADGVVDGPWLDPGREAAGAVLGGEVPGPVPAQLLKMRAEHVGREAGLASLPQSLWAPGVRQVRPDRAHDRVVEGDERLGDLVGGPVVAERVLLAADQPAVHQDVERVRQVAGLPAGVGGDAAPGGVAVGDGGQDRVVEPHVAELGLGCEQVARLAEQRAGGVQHRSLDPAVVVAGAGGGVVAGELAPVGGSTAGDRVHLDGERRVGDIPELRRQLVVERGDDELEPGAPAQRRVPR